MQVRETEELNQKFVSGQLRFRFNPWGRYFQGSQGRQLLLPVPWPGQEKGFWLEVKLNSPGWSRPWGSSAAGAELCSSPPHLRQVPSHPLFHFSCTKSSLIAQLKMFHPIKGVEVWMANSYGLQTPGHLLSASFTFLKLMSNLWTFWGRLYFTFEGLRRHPFPLPHLL